jgi:TolB protein
LWSVSADAAVEKKVVDFDEEVYNVRVSPDEKDVVIASKRSGVMNLWMRPVEEGGQFRQITNDVEAAGFPCWSPDGNWIAFQLKRGEHTFVAVMPRAGGDAIQINSDPGQSWIYDWSPNSEEVVFAGQRNGIWNIYSVSRTTRRQRQLTNFTKLNSFVRYPSWSPLNDQIVFEYSETTGNIWMADLK